MAYAWQKAARKGTYVVDLRASFLNKMFLGSSRFRAPALLASLHAARAVQVQKHDKTCFVFPGRCMHFSTASPSDLPARFKGDIKQTRASPEKQRKTKIKQRPRGYC
jgi:hypothetical protein